MTRSLDKICYVSIDVEAAGPVPGLWDMMSLGACAFRRDGTELGTFYDRLEHGEIHPDTLMWWMSQDAAWKEVHTQPIYHPSVVAHRFDSWLRGLEREHHYIRACCAPAGFDMPFVRDLSWRELGHESPLGFSALDLWSVAEGLDRKQAMMAIKAADMKTGLRDHVAVDDAIEQARKFAALFKLIDQAQ